MDVFGHDDPGPKVKTMHRSRLFQGVDKPLAGSILGQQRQSTVTRKRQKMRLTVVVVLDFLRAGRFESMDIVKPSRSAKRLQIQRTTLDAVWSHQERSVSFDSFSATGTACPKAAKQWHVSGGSSAETKNAIRTPCVILRLNPAATQQPACFIAFPWLTTAKTKQCHPAHRSCHNKRMGGVP